MKAIVAIINFLILIVSSKYLGVYSRGEISLFLLNLTIIQSINEIFTGYSIVHFVPKFNLKKIIFYGIGFTFIFSSLSNLLIVSLHKQVQGYEWFGYFISILVILNTFNCMLLLGRASFNSFNFLAFLQPFLLLIGILFFVFYQQQYTLTSYLWPLMLSFLVSFLISSFLLFKSSYKSTTTTIDFKLREILSNGFYYQMALLLFVFCNRFSFFLLVDNKKIGLYASACMLMESVLLVVNSISPILLSKVANQKTPVKLSREVLSFAKLAFLSTSFFVLLILILPENYLLFFLGKGFEGIKSLMIAYSPSVLVLSFISIISNYFTGIGKQKYILMSYLLGLFSTIFFAPYLIDNFNMLGAAYSANISYFAVAVIISFLFFYETKLSFTELLKSKFEFNFLYKLIKNQL